MTSPLDAARPARPRAGCVDDDLAPPGRGPRRGRARTSHDLLDAVARLLTGGKRLRAAFLYWGYRAAGRPDSDALVRLATRHGVLPGRRADPRRRHGRQRHPPGYAGRAPRARGRATSAGWAGDADRFGVAGAILAGNLCLTWTDELYATSGLPAERPRRGAARVFDLMRTQLMGGQFLDVVESVAAVGRAAHAASGSSGPSA